MKKCNNNKLKTIFLSVVLFCSVISSCPIFSFASVTPTTQVYDMPIQKPGVTDSSGYIEVLYYNFSTGDYECYTYQFNCVSNYSTLEQTNSYYPGVYVTCSDLTLSIKWAFDGESTSSFDCSVIGVSNSGAIFSDYSSMSTSYTMNIKLTGYNIVGAHVYGATDLLYSSSNNYDFAFLYAGEAYEYSALLKVSTLLNSIYNQDKNHYAAEIEALNDILTSSTSIDMKLTNVVSYLNTYLTDFNNFASTNKEQLEDVIYYLDKCDITLNNIDNKLQDILDILNAQGENSDWSNVDNSSINEYESAEDGLTQDKTDDFQSEVKPELDAHSSGIIWNIIEQTLQSNGLVYGMFISILAIAIIALVLNR